VNVTKQSLKNKMLTFKIPVPEIKYINEVLRNNLNIPNYQRPYKWKAAKHVKQLLEDIDRESQKKESLEYRIGTLILHEKNDFKDIVDGQQRLVTITLILYVLGFEEEYTLLKQSFTNSESKENIRYNYDFIKDYFNLIPRDRRIKFKNFLLNNCSFVVISLNLISEAFQLFDSQNTRGKTLDPIDLLKAFHLREMSENSQNDMKYCVQRWEKSIDDKILNDVIGKYLYRLRNWKRNEWVYFFTKDEIDEFKGLSIIRSIQEGKIYPYVQIAFQNSQSTNFQITETLVNGKRFFDYVAHYVQIYNEITEFLKNNEKHELKLDYRGCERIGDKRLKKLFKNVLMYYIDKFGFDESFIDFANEIYRWTFKTRLTQMSIRYQTIINLFNKDKFNPIQFIDSLYSPNILSLRSHIKPLEESIIKKNNDDIKNCINKIEKSWQN